MVIGSWFMAALGYFCTPPPNLFRHYFSSERSIFTVRPLLTWVMRQISAAFAARLKTTAANSSLCQARMADHFQC